MSRQIRVCHQIFSNLTDYPPGNELTYPLKKGTFEWMIFLFPFGGICFLVPWRVILFPLPKESSLRWEGENDLGAAGSALRIRFEDPKIRRAIFRKDPFKDGMLGFFSDLVDLFI